MANADPTREPSPVADPTISALSAALSSRYVIEREIGRGGMATVYLARDQRHDSVVALKILNAELLPLLASERFAREIRITAGLQHPHILSVLDSGEAAGSPFYTMPYVEGESLAGRLAREGPLPIPDALRIASEVGRALSYAHSRGFVHRDIKPANILLSREHAILADFGIARAIDSAGGDKLTESGLAVGTALYMSPEQAAGDTVDGRADIYAAGCVLYEMLTGSAPFSGATPQGIMARHAIDPPPSIRTVRSTVSAELEAVVTKALAKTPADRYATGDEFAAALEDAAQFGGTRVSTSTHSKRLTGRIVFGALVAAAFIVAGFAVRAHLSGAGVLDRRRVAVFPLSVSPGFKGSPSIGEDVATVVGHALDGTGSLRWIDGWRLVDARAGAKAADGTVSATMSRSLARDAHAAFYLQGRVLGNGDSALVLVDLIDVASDSVVARGRASGTTADTWRTGLRSVSAVLPALVPGSASQSFMTEWVDRAPDAITHFLLGEAAFRRARAAEALEHYREAVKLDTSFAIAAVRGAQAATWEHREGEADSLISRALTQHLSPRFTHFALGYSAYLQGRPDSASAELRRALAIDPEMSAAWMQLGETYTHLLPVEGRSDTLADHAFNEAMRLDSAAAHMLFHPIESRLRRGLTDDARPLLARFLAASPDTVLAAHVRVMETCVSKGPRAVSWQSEIRAHPLAVLGAAQSLASAGGQLDCAEAAYDAMRTFETAAMAASDAAVDSRRWTSLVGLTGVLMASGRTDTAIAHVDSAIAHKEGGASLFLLGAAAAPTFAQRASSAAQQVTAQPGAFCAQCTAERVWQLGVWASTTGDTAVLRQADAAIAAHRSTDGPLATLLQSAVDAHLALARRDSAAALTQFAAALAQPASTANGNLVWTESLGRGPERLAYARLLGRRRNFLRAIAVADVFDSPASQSYVAYLPASLALRAAMADSANLGPLADLYRRRLNALANHARRE